MSKKSSNQLCVETMHGSVIGFTDRHPASQKSNFGRSLDEEGTEFPVNKWLGIPYAQAERWKRPKSPERWESPLKCYEFGPNFPQARNGLEMIYGDRPGWIDRSWIPQSEKDGFNLNVFCPDGVQEGDKLPVLVWILGGALISGGSSMSLYDPTDWIRREASDGQKFIVITGNYRLNIFGFMACTDLRDEDSEGLAGNYGLYDCIAYLEWVRANIAKFGGDPENITAFGESAGGDIIANLMTCKKRLFRRAILQSGFPLTMPIKTLGEYQVVYDKLLEKTSLLGEDPANRLTKLREIPQSKLLSMLAGIGKCTTPGSFTIEESDHSQFYNHHESVLVRLRRGLWNPYVESVILGGCQDEGSVMAYLLRTHTPFGYKAMCDILLQGVKPKDLQELYPEQPESHTVTLDMPVDYKSCAGSRAIHDYLFGMPLYSMLEIVSRARNLETRKALQIHMYHLKATVVNVEKGKNLGVFHSADIPFIFNIKSSWLHRPENSETASLMGKSWYKFASNGLPDSTWPQYSNSAPLRRVFEQDGSCKVEDMTKTLEVEKKKREFWGKLRHPQHN